MIPTKTCIKKIRREAKKINIRLYNKSVQLLDINFSVIFWSKIQEMFFTGMV